MQNNRGSEMKERPTGGLPINQLGNQPVNLPINRPVSSSSGGKADRARVTVRPSAVNGGQPQGSRPASGVRNVIIEKDGAKNRPQDKKESDTENARNRKFYLQRWKDISWMRRILMLVFGPLFLWCVAPAFFSIRGIGVIASSAVMLFIFLTAMLWHLIDRNWNWVKGLICTAVGLIFSACVVAFCVVSGIMLKASMTTVPENCPNYTVVVLGCKAHGSQPSWMLEDRLNKAYRVLSDNPRVMCVVTGGQGDDEQYSEAYVMKKYLTDKGISADRIITEDASQSTEENLLYTKAVIELNGLSKNIVIVTDRFHELRARQWAEKSGFEHIYADCCETRPYLVIGYWFREMFGLARLYLFGV